MSDRVETGRSRSEAENGGVVKHSSVPLLLVGTVALALLLFMSWQASSLRRQVAEREAERNTVRATFDWNIRMSSLEGAPLAPSLARVLEGTVDPAARSGVLVVSYMPTVCTTCLRAGLRSLTEVEGALRERGIVLRGLVAERSGSHQYVVLLRHEGLLDFPVAFVSAASLESMPGGEREGFSDTPLYLLLDESLQVKSVFKADQWNDDLLEQWLDAVLVRQGG